MLFSDMVIKLMKAGVLPTVNPEDDSKTVVIFLRYGFWLAVPVALLGLCLQFYQAFQDSETAVQKGKAEVASNNKAMMQAIIEQNRQDGQTEDLTIKDLTSAVAVLSQDNDIKSTGSQITQQWKP